MLLKDLLSVLLCQSIYIHVYTDSGLEDSLKIFRFSKDDLSPAGDYLELEVLEVFVNYDQASIRVYKKEER